MVSGSGGRRAFAENMCDHVSVTNSGRKTEVAHTEVALDPA